MRMVYLANFLLPQTLQPKELIPSLLKKILCMPGLKQDMLER
ncbi:hypothetical protein SLEP1_g1184 [Rubroshorea leprosula]|uniref:Uncharacterized protein n=1 Tax=Rubroshorea leprosula TaxID=152421 RepID=A0AAV5HD09_9ROSI|nr:hypothetical protein SLEP1_g1184 [Rubroshorea leprosula]